MTEIASGLAADRIPDAVWRKSSNSGALGNCVELARLPGGEVAIRNSRFPSGPALVCNREDMLALLTAVKDGELDAFL